MDWFRVRARDVASLRIHSDTVLGAWVRCLAYVAETETRGVMVGAAAWKARHWMAGPGISIRDAKKLIASGILSRTRVGSDQASTRVGPSIDQGPSEDHNLNQFLENSDSLVVFGYQVNDEIALHKCREAGKLGGRPKNPTVNPGVTENHNPPRNRSDQSREEKKIPPGGETVVSQPAPKAAPKSGKHPNRADEAMGWFRERWSRQYGVTWTPDVGSPKMLAEAVAAMDDASFASLPEAFDRYLADQKPIILEARHPLKWLLGSINQYRVSREDAARARAVAESASRRAEEEAERKRRQARREWEEERATEMHPQVQGFIAGIVKGVS